MKAERWGNGAAEKLNCFKLQHNQLALFLAATQNPLPLFLAPIDTHNPLPFFPAPTHDFCLHASVARYI